VDRWCNSIPKSKWVEKSLQRSEELAAKYGERFNPPQLLKDKAQKKEIIQ
jgi:3-hydroxyacyl-CoA dehydrogenase/enoyl-CoA hydratase/3-hydroxybutyryl-CoA epimerase